MAKTRETHVWRVKNPDDENIWIDIERVDKIVGKEEGQGQLYRKTTRNMFWGEEASDEPHPTRETTVLRVENPEDADQFVEVHVIDEQITRRDQGPGYQKTTKRFDNEKETNTVREFTVRRVYHWDTATDPSLDGGLDYIRIEDTKDADQYLDVAVIEEIVQTRGQGPGFKKRTFRFNTDPIKEFSEPAPDDVDPASVVWLDPWQNIINVQWGPQLEFVVILTSVGLIWEPTEEYVVDGAEPCEPSFGYTALERNGVYLIHFGVTDFGEPPHVTGGEISGLDWPFPISIDLSPWQFVGMHAGFLNRPAVRLDWEENEDGEVIVDGDGDPVEAFPGVPFRRGDTANFAVRGQAFTSGPQCWQTFGGPGGDVPTLGSFVEDISGVNYTSVIPGTEQELSITSITVEYQDQTFQGCGYYASGTDLRIICEKVTS